MGRVWIDTHGHLAAGFQFSELDKFAGLAPGIKIWLHAIEGLKNSARHSGNRMVLEVARRYSGLFESFAFVDLSGKPEQIDRYADEGFTGLKFIYPPDDYDSLKFMPFYERANANGMPCFFHTGIIARRGSGDFTLPGRNGSPGRMKPSMLDTIAAEFPELKLISGHMGVPWCNEMRESLWFYPNIRCSVCGLSDYRWLMDHLGDAAEDGTPFVRKMMFASDAAYGLPGVFERLERRASFFRTFFAEAGAMSGWRFGVEDFMHGNAEKLIPERTNQLETEDRDQRRHCQKSAE